jgi:hypothetical protein
MRDSAGEVRLACLHHSSLSAIRLRSSFHTTCARHLVLSDGDPLVLFTVPVEVLQDDLRQRADGRDFSREDALSRDELPEAGPHLFAGLEDDDVRFKSVFLVQPLVLD